MNDRLPDVARTERAVLQAPLDWVGMQGIDLPLQLHGALGPHPVHARVDAQVNLPEPHVKGIHMSRLYILLDQFAQHQQLSAAALKRLLSAMIASHADCGTTRARVRIGFKLLARRPALVTPDLAGWKAYPAHLEATWDQDRVRIEAVVTVTYSSTCPCSAALSRQLVAQAFDRRFPASQALRSEDISAWLGEHATLATPHSQRSLAEVRVRLGEDDDIDWFALIDGTEAALGTAVQTAVKRADEQAFARINGDNLMYVEDAARRIRGALKQRYPELRVQVRHLESLHPHDAVAQASSG